MATGLVVVQVGMTGALARENTFDEQDWRLVLSCRYLLDLTEELWETAYADEVKLLAVDRPDSVEVFVDERFVPPGPGSPEAICAWRSPAMWSG